MRPALTCEIATAPRAPFEKRRRIVAASSVAISRGIVFAARSVEKVSTGPAGWWRTFTNVARSAMTLSTRRPPTKLARSSQWDPMSPTARRLPPSAGSSRQFQSVSSRSQSWK